MTECNGPTLLFSSLGRKKILADFTGGDLTSDGGLPLLREVDRKLGLLDALSAAIHDPRDPEAITHHQRTLLAQRVLALAAGYEDLNDHITLRKDPLLTALTDRPLKKDQDEDDPLASSATLCRLENRITRPDLWRMSAVFVQAFIASHPTPPAELILDFDATDIPVHGQQEGRFFHGYYDHYCFLPLYVFCGDQLLASYLRPANIDAARHSRAILKLLVQALRAAWPQVKIVFRGDSGFCRWRLIRWCDRHQVDYLLGLAKNPVLLNKAAGLMAQAKQEYEANKVKARLFAEDTYAAETWDQPRRILMKAEHSAQGENPRFVVTSLSGASQTLYDEVYCQRGEAENRIKEQQLDLFATRTSCHEFLANQFRLLLAAAGNVLVETLRRVGLAGTELEQAQAGTIRLKLLKIGGRVVRSVRRLALHLASAFPLMAVLRTALENLRRWTFSPLVGQPTTKEVPHPSS